ncbi:MAG: helix-turn-helix domain containing protein [Rhodobacteraceae bacterium]|nr:helix-turn-helix domain containing protein [Paracoccaceae bacterium]
MMNDPQIRSDGSARLPGWVSLSVRHYLAHTEGGQPIRDLARRCGCHASTVLRQIRKVEQRRDDPLVDAALASLALLARGEGGDAQTRPRIADLGILHDEARRVLGRLCETGAVLAVAEDMEKAVVVRDADAGAGMRTAVVDRDVAGALALSDWIAGSGKGRVRRYMITTAGRGALNKLLAETANAARSRVEHGFAEAPQAFAGQKVADPFEPETRNRRARYGVVESPLVALSRRRDKDGKPFLSDDLVRAGERLREDFELAQIGPQVTQDWETFLVGGVDETVTSDAGPNSAAARVQGALAELGPGLSDVALRCCCMLEGLETAEKRMGWSARSGKIVLRIALQRLKRYYQEPSARDYLIG